MRKRSSSYKLLFSLLPTHRTRRRACAAHVVSTPESHRQMQEDTHMLMEESLNAQVGEKRRTRHTRLQVHRQTRMLHTKQQRTVAQTPGQSNASWYWQSTFFTKHSKQLDYVFMNRALFKHCKDAEKTGQIDMSGGHAAVIARSELPINRKTQPIQRSSKRAKKQRRGGDNKLDWSEHTTSIYHAHQEQPLNTTNSTRRPTTQHRRNPATILGIL